MKCFVRTSVATLAALVLVAGAASAQLGTLTHRMVHFGIGGGVSVPTSDAGNVLEDGINGQAWVSVTPRWVPVTLRAAFDIQRNQLGKITTQTTSGTTTTTQTFSGGTNQVLAGLANVRMDLLHGGIQPYLTLGLGGYNVKTDPDGVNAPSSSATHFGVNGGAGLALRTGPIHIFVEGRVDNVYTEKGLIDTKTVQLIPVTLGISF